MMNIKRLKRLFCSVLKLQVGNVTGFNLSGRG